MAESIGDTWCCDDSCVPYNLRNFTNSKCILDFDQAKINHENYLFDIHILCSILVLYCLSNLDIGWRLTYKYIYIYIYICIYII